VPLSDSIDCVMGDLADHVKCNILFWPRHVVDLLDKQKDDSFGRELLCRRDVEFMSEVAIKRGSAGLKDTF
jgi:hypothetical protein